jgi:ABC-type Fe3+ transport system permease subunit
MMMAVWRVWCVAVVVSMCVLRAQGHDGAFEQRKIAAAEVHSLTNSLTNSLTHSLLRPLITHLCSLTHSLIDCVWNV